MFKKHHQRVYNPTEVTCIYFLYRKPEEAEKWLNETKDGAKIVSEVHTTRRTYGSAAEMTNSYFDIAFQPTAEVTHKTVWPQVSLTITRTLM